MIKEGVLVIEHVQETTINTSYPSSQLLALLLLGDEVLWRHLQLKLGELVFPADSSAGGER